MNRAPRIIILVIVAGVILFLGIKVKGFFGGMGEPQPKKPRPEMTRVVQATPVAYKQQSTRLSYFGRITSAQPVDLIAEVQGRILPGSVPLKAGQNFRRGTLLFRIDSEEAKLNLQSQKSQFMKSLADILADLKVDFSDRYAIWESYFQKIEIDKPIPELPEITDLKEKTFLSTRSIISTWYSIKSQEERLKKYNSYAPYSGSIGEVLLETGSVANPGTRIARILRTDKLELVVPVQTSDIKWVTKGTEVNLVSDELDASWKGKVARVGDQVEVTTQSINVYITVNQNKETPLYDGLYLRAEIPGTVVKEAMEIPRRAVFEERKVYVIVEGKLKERSIQIHKVNAQTVLFSGLKEGEMLVTEIPVNAVENMNVKTAGQP